MALAKESSLLIGLGVAAAAWAIHSNLTPSLADVRVAPPGDRDVSSSERAATGLALGLVTGVAVLAQDATVFIIGATAVVATAWAYRHANAVNPATGRVIAGTAIMSGAPVMDESAADAGIASVDY